MIAKQKTKSKKRVKFIGTWNIQFCVSRTYPSSFQSNQKLQPPLVKFWSQSGRFTYTTKILKIACIIFFNILIKRLDQYSLHPQKTLQNTFQLSVEIYFINSKTLKHANKYSHTCFSLTILAYLPKANYLTTFYLTW